MADVKVVKSIYTGADVTSLGEVAAADTVALPGPLKVVGTVSNGANVLTLDAELHVTAATHLDEAVAMSDKAPKNSVLIGDGTAGRKLKSAIVVIQDGTGANTIKCTVESYFNGDAIGATDNIGKGATTGNFTLDAVGSYLTIEAAGLTGNCVGVLAWSIHYNSTALTIPQISVSMFSNDIHLAFRNGAGMTDITEIGVGTSLQVIINYITSA